MSPAEIDKLAAACRHLKIKITSAIVTSEGATIEVRDSVNGKRWDFGDDLKPKAKSCSKRVRRAIKQAAEIAGEGLVEIVACPDCNKGWTPSRTHPGKFARCVTCYGTGRQNDA